jgi:two-component system, NarL family, response regulator LiaR
LSDKNCAEVTPAKKSETISVLVVDDHELVRQGIETFLNLQSDIDIVASTANATQAIKQVSELVPDVVLMDLNLGEGMNGIEATRQIKSISPQSKVIVLTSFHSDEYIFPAIKSGALSYLLKDIEPSELAGAIRKAALGQAVLAPIVAKRIVEEMQPEIKEAIPNHSQLSIRELEILKMIAEGYNNQEISESLGIVVKTVRCHVSNILSKLHLRDRTQAAIHALQKGLT